MQMTNASPVRKQAGEATPPQALLARIRESIAATPVPAGRASMRLFVALVIVPVVTALVVATASEVVYERQAVGLQIGIVSASRVLWVLCLLALLAVASTAIAVWRGAHGLGARVVSLALAAALATPLYAALIAPAPVHSPEAGVPWVQISPFGGRCLIVAAIVGVTALVSFAVALRHAAPAASRLRSAALGAAAGAWAGLAVFIFCPSGDQQHLLLGHVLPLAALTALGAFALPRALRP